MSVECPEASCTCSVIKYDPVDHGGGRFTERWRCSQCGSTFVRESMVPTIAAVEGMREVVCAARQLEFVALTPGPHIDNPSFEDILTDLILYEQEGGARGDYALSVYRERVDAARRERIRWAWSKLRRAIEIDGSRRGR